MWIEYFKHTLDVDGTVLSEFPERKVIQVNPVILEINWPAIFKLFGNRGIARVKIYLDWAEPQSVAYLIQQYCRYREVPCDIMFGKKLDVTDEKSYTKVKPIVTLLNHSDEIG